MHNLADLIARHKLNAIKLTLYPIEDGYEFTMDISGQLESMFFTYQESEILELIDQGVLPTIILSGISQSLKVRYLYNDYVILEVTDRRDPNKPTPTPEVCMLRVSEGGIYKLTAVDVRRGDVEEERSLLAARASGVLQLDPTDMMEHNRPDDGYAFMRGDWFAGLLEPRRLRRARRRLQHLDIHGDEVMSTTDLRASVRSFLRRDSDGCSDGVTNPWSSGNGGVEMYPAGLGVSVDPAKIAQHFRIKPTIKRKLPSNEYIEESIEEIRVESQSSAVSQLKVYRREPDGQHFGCLCVLNWEGGDSSPVRFPLGREVSMGRFLRQFVDAQTSRATSVFIRTREMAAKAKQQQLAAAAAALAEQQQQKSVIARKTVAANSGSTSVSAGGTSSEVAGVVHPATTASTNIQIVTSTTGPGTVVQQQQHVHHVSTQPQQLQRGASAYQMAVKQQQRQQLHGGVNQSPQTAAAVLLANQIQQQQQQQVTSQQYRWPMAGGVHTTSANIMPTSGTSITTVKRVV